jgi:2-polyprenyl-3-methyl-5-hydroxy-6-metoxy-1,4-benzoquinol methylase
MKKYIKIIVGLILIIILPKRTRELIGKGVTVHAGARVKDRLIRYAILEKAKKKKDFETLSNFHQDYWINNGAQYFSSEYNDNILENFFIPKCSFLFDLLQDQLKKESGKFNTLIEIGTGDGTILEHLSTKFPQINKFVGIDLSNSQIEVNKKVFSKNNKLEFIASDGLDWIKKNGHDHMIIVTSRGVLEYFTRSKLQAFFDQLNKLGKIIFLAIEPTGVNHDFYKNPDSEIYGLENSFSHNYTQLFKNSGFVLWHKSEELFASPECYMNFIGAKN